MGWQAGGGWGGMGRGPLTLSCFIVYPTSCYFGGAKEMGAGLHTTHHTISAQIVGGRVLNITGGDGPVLAYAHCGTAGNGSVVVLAVNPTTEAFSLDFGVRSACC